MSEYILSTKFYNEREKIPLLIENISEQSLHPRIFLFVDDGSIDESGRIAEEKAGEFGIEYRIVSLPKKQKGNLDTLGKAWNKSQPLIKELLAAVPYFATADVDTKFPQNYFERMVNYLDRHPKVGVVAG